MPLNTLRLNYQPSSHPNERIVFIKPIPRPPSQKNDYDRAELVLKAIAAQCLPIMKNNHLSVTTLEEYEPNPEFIGRNFNNGEIIQLVIQSKSGSWLPLNMIQMVMMHELAHNTHMNHGKGFWQTRNNYADEMRQLWSRGYTGEGLWGSGRSLSTIQAEIGNNIMRSEELASLPLCGGTFRSRRKKRKAKGESSDLTWKEKRDKRIEKKFGKNGNALGDDEDKRMILEINNKIKTSLGSKPRVAQSKRGRELRAAAALARFETNKKEVNELHIKHEKETENESDYEELDTEQELARDFNGRIVVDGQGRGTIRVCEQEDSNDADVKQEMDELANLDSIPEASLYSNNSTFSKSSTAEPKAKHGIGRFQRQKAAAQDTVSQSSSSETSTNFSSGVESTSRERRVSNEPRSPVHDTDQQPDDLNKATRSLNLPNRTHDVSTTGPSQTNKTSCPICSMSNDPLRATCAACSHVLDTGKDPRHWSCTSSACSTEYINAGDCGVCGICGARKTVDQEQAGHAEGDRNVKVTYSGHIAYV